MYCETYHRSTQFTLRISSSKFANSKFFKVCIALFSVPFPACVQGILYSISMLQLLQNSMYFLEIKTPPLSDCSFSGLPYELKLFAKNLITSFVSKVLHNFAVSLRLSKNLNASVHFLCDVLL